jgi:hypothetical protein
MGYDQSAPPAWFDMARDRNPKAQQMRSRIAAAAARIMAEDGIDDFALAKRKAARTLGATDTHAMPGNDEVEQALRAYQALYQGEEQRERLDELREAAAELLRALAPFRPYLTGPVLAGTAGRYSGIELQLFTDDTKGVELFFVNQGLTTEGREHRYFVGDQPRNASIIRLDWNDFPVTMVVLAATDERSVLKTTIGGRPIERAGLAAVEALIESSARLGGSLYNPAEV